MLTCQQMVINQYTDRKADSLAAEPSVQLDLEYRTPDCWSRHTSVKTLFIWPQRGVHPSACSLNCSDLLFIFNSTCQDVWTEQPRLMSCWHVANIRPKTNVFCCAVVQNLVTLLQEKRHLQCHGDADANDIALDHRTDILTTASLNMKTFSLALSEAQLCDEDVRERLSNCHWRTQLALCLHCHRLTARLTKKPIRSLRTEQSKVPALCHFCVWNYIDSVFCCRLVWKYFALHTVLSVYRI